MCSKPYDLAYMFFASKLRTPLWVRARFKPVVKTYSHSFDRVKFTFLWQEKVLGLSADFEILCRSES